MIRKLTANVLIALLLMPSLVCAMPVCHQSQEQAPAEASPHCAERAAAVVEFGESAAAVTESAAAVGEGAAAVTESAAAVGESAAAVTEKVMLVSDCMGVDLQQSPQPFVLDQPTTATDFLDVSGSAFWLAFEEDFGRIEAIRAPPQAQSNVQTLPPVYLITQRFRL